MGQFLTFIIGMYFLITLVISPYMWAKRTNRTQAPIERRLRAIAYASTWPAIVYRHFATDRGQIGSRASVPPQPPRAGSTVPPQRAAGTHSSSYDPYNSNSSSLHK